MATHRASAILLFIAVCLSAASALNPSAATNSSDAEFLSHCGRNQCPVVAGCGPGWNVIQGAKKEKCCYGDVTVHGTCSGSCGFSRPCQCNDLDFDDYCAARSSHTCPPISSVVSERATNNQTSLRIVGQFRNQVEAQGVDANEFFTFLMNAYEQAYKQDSANLIAFQAIMEQKNPPPPENVLGSFVFGIFKHLLETLADVDDIGMGWVVRLVEEEAKVTVETNANEKVYYANIEWEQFLEMKTLDLQQNFNMVTNGLWNYTTAFWKHHDFPLNLNDTNSTQYALAEKLIVSQWSQMRSQTEAFVNFIGDYMNAVGSGLVMSCNVAYSPTKYSWGISQVPNAGSLMPNLMRLTDGCLKPSENFKDSNGTPVGMAFGATVKGEHGRRQGKILTKTGSAAILSSDEQSKDSGEMLFCTEPSKFINPSFPITRHAS